VLSGDHCFVFLAHFSAFWRPLFCVSATYQSVLANIIMCFWHT
jgi:hypothetical protein